MNASSDDIDVSTLLSAIKRSLPRILLASVVVGGLTYGVLALVTPYYKSQAQIILQPSSGSILRPQGADTGSGDGKIDESEVASQVEVVRSRDLFTKVVEAEHLDELPEFNSAATGQGLIGNLLALIGGSQPGSDGVARAVNQLALNVRVNPVPKTRLINIEVVTHDAALSARLANAIAQAFLERNRASQVKDANNTTNWIGSNIADIKSQAETAETALGRFKAENGLLSGQNNVTLNSQQLSELNTQLTQATAARTEAEARARIIREMITGNGIENSQEIVKAPNMQALFAQKLRVERDIGELSTTLLPAHPRMRQLTAELEITRARLREEAKRVAAGLSDDVKVTIAREAALRASIASVTDTQLKSSSNQAKLSSLEREAQSKRGAYELVLQRLSEASSRKDSAVVSALASLNESAVASNVADSPKKLDIAVPQPGAKPRSTLDDASNFGG